MTSKRPNGDGTIYKAHRTDGSAVWKVEVTLGHTPDGRPRRTRRTAGSYADARGLLKKLQSEKLQGRASQIRSDTVLTYGLDWIRNVKAQQVKPTTAADYEDRLRRSIAPYLGKVRLIDLTPRHVEQWMADLRRSGMSAQTVNGARQVLNALCKHAARSGAVPHNPVASTDPVKRQPGDSSRVQHPWTREEVNTVLTKVLGEDSLDAFVHLMLHTGLRPGEALGLRWCDVDLSMGRLNITGTLKQDRRILPNGRGVVGLTRNTPKTADSARTLPVGDALRAALERQQMRQSVSRATNEVWVYSGYVVTSNSGTPVSASNLRRQFVAFLSKIGVRRIRMHDMRHTVAVLALNDGNLPLEKVSQALGHGRIDTTKRIYAPNVRRYNDDFVAGVGALLPAAPVPVSPDFMSPARRMES